MPAVWSLFRRTSTRRWPASGHSGGKERNPTYEQVGSHTTSHLEVIEGESQHLAAERSRRETEASGVLQRPIATGSLAASKIRPAKDYHNDFWKKDPIHCRTNCFGCGCDRRLAQIWGKALVKSLVH